MTETVVIAPRFHGPRNSGNGGYSCGVAARFIDGPAESTLRAPPPLSVPMEVVREGDAVSLRYEGKEIARSRPATPNVAPPQSPGAAVAERASQRYPGHTHHAFPTCFTCGPAHPEGLHIFAGPVEGESFVAGPWVPGADLAADDGLIANEIVWAALDCPSYWSLPGAGDTLICVLGRLTAAIDRRPAPGEKLVVVGWPLGSSGRKHNAGTAIYDARDKLIARAHAVWIEVNPEDFK